VGPEFKPQNCKKEKKKKKGKGNKGGAGIWELTEQVTLIRPVVYVPLA
jgi:hypothetical protein